MASGTMAKRYCGVKFQEFNQQVAITTQAAIGYYSSPIALNIPDGYTPIGIQWISDWVNMAIPIFRSYIESTTIHLHFMCPSSITATMRFKVIYAQKN